MPNALVEKCCTPCRGIPPLTLDVARRYLAQDTPDATREVRQHRCLVAEVSAAAPSVRRLPVRRAPMRRARARPLARAVRVHVVTARVAEAGGRRVHRARASASAIARISAAARAARERATNASGWCVAPAGITSAVGERRACGVQGS